MKKWLKSEVCGSVNSTWMYCSKKTWSTTAAEKKINKEKKKKKRKKKLKTRYSAKRGRGVVSKPTLNLIKRVRIFQFQVFFLLHVF